MIRVQGWWRQCVWSVICFPRKYSQKWSTPPYGISILLIIKIYTLTKITLCNVVLSVCCIHCYIMISKQASKLTVNILPCTEIQVTAYLQPTCYRSAVNKQFDKDIPFKLLCIENNTDLSLFLNVCSNVYLISLFNSDLLQIVPWIL